MSNLRIVLPTANNKENNFQIGMDSSGSFSNGFIVHTKTNEDTEIKIN